MRAWINRYTVPKTGDASPGAGQKPAAVHIDIDVLARRHAAWQLADALQKGAPRPTQARQITVKLPAVGANQKPLGAGALWAPAPRPVPDALAVRPARVVRASASNIAAQQNSRATLDNFLADLRERQAALENAQDELARRALEDRIRVATRGAVEAIPLAPVSPETALELSNLRLQLLKQLSVPAAQQAAATAKIEAIEARLNEIWSAQTAAQNARLRAALEELPARLRREGLVALSEAAARRQSERVAQGAELRRAIEARLSGAAPANDAQILRLFLPPARVASADYVGTGPNFSARRVQTASVPAPSEATVAPARALGQNEDFSAANIARLRAQARRDAREWARTLALSWGTALGDSSAPDRTAQAETALFGRQS